MQINSCIWLKTNLSLAQSLFYIALYYLSIFLIIKYDLGQLVCNVAKSTFFTFAFFGLSHAHGKCTPRGRFIFNLDTGLGINTLVYMLPATKRSSANF